jgi:hypothetical protein
MIGGDDEMSSRHMEVGWSQGNGNLKAVPTNEYGKVQPGTAVSFSEPRPKALSNETVYRCNTFLNLQWCFVLVLMLFIKTVASMPPTSLREINHCP